MVDVNRERRLERCDSVISRYRYGLLQRGDRWKLVAFEGMYSRSSREPEAWRQHPEWMTLEELEACLGLAGTGQAT
jgi:hypothetical protein